MEWLIPMPGIIDRCAVSLPKNKYESGNEQVFISFLRQNNPTFWAKSPIVVTVAASLLPTIP